MSISLAICQLCPSVNCVICVSLNWAMCVLQTSLEQFTGIYVNAIDASDASHILSRRIMNLTLCITKSVWTSTLCGLFEKDKPVFTLLLAQKVASTNGKVNHGCVYTCTSLPFISHALMHHNTLQVVNSVDCVDQSRGARVFHERKCGY
jgi:hypothetical protein